MTTPDEASQEQTNYDTFRDCVFSAIVDKSTDQAPSRKASARRRHKQEPTTPTSTSDHPSSDPSELADFSSYLASEIFTFLPAPLRSITHTPPKPSSPSHDEPYTLPLTLTTLEALTSHLPPSVADTLTTYGLTTPPRTDTTTFLTPILTAYIKTATTPPPPPSSTRATATTCELCDRDHIPLTYHHLIPRSTHARVLKRAWHPPEALQSVAWLCRACHSFVHAKVGSNEELAREWFTVERLKEREDVRRWAAWVGGVRWKKR
jgi:hypothetical protein